MSALDIPTQHNRFGKSLEEHKKHIAHVSDFIGGF